MTNLFSKNCMHILSTILIILLIMFIIVDALSFNEAIQTTINKSILNNHVNSDGDIVLYKWLYFLGASIVTVLIAWFLYYKLKKELFSSNNSGEKLCMSEM